MSLKTVFKSPGKKNIRKSPSRLRVIIPLRVIIAILFPFIREKLSCLLARRGEMTEYTDDWRLFHNWFDSAESSSKLLNYINQSQENHDRTYGIKTVPGQRKLETRPSIRRCAQQRGVFIFETQFSRCSVVRMAICHALTSLMTSWENWT